MFARKNVCDFRSGSQFLSEFLLVKIFPYAVLYAVVFKVIQNIDLYVAIPLAQMFSHLTPTALTVSSVCLVNDAECFLK